MKLYNLKSLYNYFIMDDIKYFFINNNQTIQKKAQKFLEKQITESIT
jgi:hypothetical protein